MQSPAQIDEPQWDSSSNTFAYSIKNRVYVRDSISLILQDSFPKNENSDLSPFYSSPRKAIYPLVNLKPDGNSITIISQKNASSAVERKTVKNLPATVKAAAINNNRTHIAFLGNDGKAYVYDLKTESVCGSMNYYQSTNDIFFTYDNKVLLADTAKTAAFYSLTGQKQKTITNATQISAIDLSADGETLVIADSTGSLSFYNTSSYIQIGYSPVLSTKNVKKLKLSYDSSKIIIIGRDNTLCVAEISDILYATNTLAPKVDQFNFKYSQIDPTKREEIVIEFGQDEIIIQDAVTDAEYITTTIEKEKEKQNFVLEDEIPEPSTIVVIKQPEQDYFPPTVIEAAKTNEEKRNPIKEKKPPVVTEIPQPKKEVTTAETETKKEIPSRLPNEKKTVVTVTPETGKSTGNGENVKVIDNTADKSVDNAKAPLTIVVNNIGNGTGGGSGTGAGSGDDESENEPEEAVPAPAKTEKKDKKASKKEKTVEPKTEVKTEHISLSKDWKRIRTYDDEDIKTLFKDGHGILINAGIQKIITASSEKKNEDKNQKKDETYNFYLDVPIGYRNYDLLRPFYFGGTAETSFGVPSNNFPYKYFTKSGKLVNPLLFSECIYVPFGLCMYPWKNSLEVYWEVGLGASFSCLWNGNFGGGLKRSSFFPAFYGNVKIGAAWDFMNLSMCGSYDAIKGFSFGAELGALINIGGTRTIGSLIKK